MDRKEIVRTYKETPRPAGVYRVIHTTTGSHTLGSSKNVPAMLNRIRFELEGGWHRNRDLQDEWNAAPPDEFVFEIVDVLEPSDDPATDLSEDLAELEEMWRQRFGHSCAEGTKVITADWNQEQLDEAVGAVEGGVES